MKTIVLVSPYWHEPHRWMQSSVRLADLWQRIGYRVVVACLGSTSGTERVSDTLTVHRVRDRFAPDPWNYGIAAGFSGFVESLVERERPDVIVVNKVLFWTSLALLPLARRGYPVVLLTDVLAGVNWMPRTPITRIVARIAGRTLQPFLLRRATQVVLSHPAPADALHRLGIAGRTRVIPTGLDPSHYSTGAPLRPVLTYVGRVESNKGVDDFLAAAVALQARDPALTIRVVGPHRPAHPLVSEYGDRVEFVGYHTDVRPWLRDTSVFVLPSRGEGLSNALMEAMATGCACVVSDAGGNPWLVEDGVSGLVFPRGDREALSRQLRRLLDDAGLRARIGEAGRARIEDRFSWENLGARWQELFAEMESRTAIEGDKVDEVSKVGAPLANLANLANASPLSPARPRVVLLSPFLSPHRYGAEALTEELATRLATGREMTIVAARLRRSFPREETLPSGVHVVRVGLGMAMDKWLYPFLAALAVRRLRPGVAHATLESFAGLALALVRWTCPAALRVQTLGTMSRHFLRGPITRSAHVVTAVSNAMRALAARHGRGDATVIPNGVDTARIQRAITTTERVPGRIVFVGRLVPIKGVDTLLRAMAQVLNSPSRPPVLPSARIIGDGPMRPELTRLAKELGVLDSVTFTGYLPPEEVTRELAAAQICVGLSRNEAFGLALLEAQAAGCAVLGANVGGIRDFIDDGVNGLLVPPGDVNAAARALERLLSDHTLRARLAENAQVSAARHDWDAIADRYVAVYEEGRAKAGDGGQRRTEELGARFARPCPPLPALSPTSSWQRGTIHPTSAGTRRCCLCSRDR